MGKLIAHHMVESVSTSAHVQSFIEVDVTNVVNWRNKVKDGFEKREGEKLTFTPIFNVIKKKNINLGMAAALPDGNLIVPVIKNADQLNLVGMAKTINDLANRARNNALKPDEVKDGTYTVTNVGSFGSVFGTPIINQPQVAILALGAIRKMPSVIETPEGDFIGVRSKMFLSHSYDHRVVNGALGGMFIKTVADYLESWDVNIKLTKPICFFDLETTGINVAKDRIVEISILKIFPNGNKESKTWLVNPEMEIPPQVIAVHGITNEKVANEPTFKELSKEIYTMIKDSDLGGFNSDRFDIPLLAEEMLRAEVDFDMKNMVSVDVQTIFHKMEKRTLGAAYKFYCGKDLEDAHSAEADTMATYEVLLSQLERYPDLENNIKKLSEFTTRKQSLDFAGFIGVDENDNPTFAFGKHKGKTVDEVLEKEPGYFGWILNADFPLYTKKVLTQLKLSKLNNKLS